MKYLVYFVVSLNFVKMDIDDYSSEEELESITLDPTDTTQDRRPHLAILVALTDEKHVEILPDSNKYFNQDIDITTYSFVLSSNPLMTMSKLCELGNVSRARVIISGHTNQINDLTSSAIAYIGNFLRIPVINVGSRENIFSDKVN